ncbi:MAG TPA: ABC transporter permease, partial [Chryseosolibacter sp.]
MLRNYFNIAWRHLWKNKFFSLINVAGLAAGIAACLLIFVFIRYEKGFDRFHPAGIYRLVEVQQKEGIDAPQKIARTKFPMGPTLKSEFPEIADFVRIMSVEREPLQLPGGEAVMATWGGADASLLRVFNFKLVLGDASTALARPGTIILTERLARQLFGSQNPVGMTVRNQGRDTTDYTVTGILQDMPDQSHIQLDALYSFSTELIAGESADWGNDWMFTYLSLREGADPRALEAKFPGYLEKYMGAENARRYQLFLQPVRDIHLWSEDITQDMPGIGKFNGSYLPVLAAVALLVLALAVINYVNLTTALSIARAPEIAVRKTTGAGRVQIALQFLGETGLLTLIAVAMALAMAYLCLPLLNIFTGSETPFDIWGDPSLLLAGGGIALGTGL